MLASYWQDLCLSTFIKCHCTTYWVRLLVQQETQRRFSRRINSSVRSALKCHNGIKGCRRQDENVKHSFIMSKIPLVPLDKQQYERSEKSLFSKWRYVMCKNSKKTFLVLSNFLRARYARWMHIFFHFPFVFPSNLLPNFSHPPPRVFLNISYFRRISLAWQICPTKV